MEQTNNQPKTSPEKHITAGAIRASIWKNETVNKEGQPQSSRSVTFERSYKDKEGNWKITSSLQINDLPKAILVLNKAYEYLAMKE